MPIIEKELEMYAYTKEAAYVENSSCYRAFLKNALDKKEFLGDTDRMLNIKNAKLRFVMAILIASIHVTPAFAFSSNSMCGEYMVNYMSQPASSEASVDHVDIDQGAQNNDDPMCNGDMAKCSSCNLALSDAQDFRAFGEALLNLPATPSLHTVSYFSFDRPPQINS